MLTEEIQKLTSQYLMHTYDRLPLSIARGQGSRVFDAEGRDYLDCVAGIAVNVLGHAHPDLVQSIERQARQLLHTSNLYYTQAQAELAQGLATRSFADKVFFTNSGAEANEAAIKLARKYSHDHYGTDRAEIVTVVNSFHGRTLATLSATGQDKVKHGFAPLVPGFRHVPLNDLSALEAAVTEHTAAIMLELVLGEGGVSVANQAYVDGIKALCKQRGILLILDEIQTGMGRTGTLFAYEQYGLEPDIMTLAKGLGGGIPIGACLASDAVAQSFGPGTHGSTFGGNPFACSVALQVLRTLTEGAVLDNCRARGAQLHEGLRELQTHYACVQEVRGLGLLQGMELSIDGKPIVSACLTHRVLINCTMGNVLRFIPPLIISERDVVHLLDVLTRVLKTHATKAPAH